MWQMEKKKYRITNCFAIFFLQRQIYVFSNTKKINSGLCNQHVYKTFRVVHFLC